MPWYGKSPVGPSSDGYCGRPRKRTKNPGDLIQEEGRAVFLKGLDAESAGQGIMEVDSVMTVPGDGQVGEEAGLRTESGYSNPKTRQLADYFGGYVNLKKVRARSSVGRASPF